MRRLGLEIGEEHFYTSALATAAFLSQQCPDGSAFVIGETGMINALYNAGFSMNDSNPDYVVVVTRAAIVMKSLNRQSH